uniref:Uncharacterized protein n=1 Tax=Siphoviridae sp. ctaLC6 TaxID=2826387 RepID=A0A8S5MPM2_9CAUD|nr:MAG TPA: hypothetical protein [Siphoviridae sp. ctaLC6]
MDCSSIASRFGGHSVSLELKAILRQRKRCL